MRTNFYSALGLALIAATACKTTNRSRANLLEESAAQASISSVDGLTMQELLERNPEIGAVLTERGIKALSFDEVVEQIDKRHKKRNMVVHLGNDGDTGYKNSAIYRRRLMTMVMAAGPGTAHILPGTGDGIGMIHEVIAETRRDFPGLMNGVEAYSIVSAEEASHNPNGLSKNQSVVFIESGNGAREVTLKDGTSPIATLLVSVAAKNQFPVTLMVHGGDNKALEVATQAIGASTSLTTKDSIKIVPVLGVEPAVGAGDGRVGAATALADFLMNHLSKSEGGTPRAINGEMFYLFDPFNEGLSSRSVFTADASSNGIDSEISAMKAGKTGIGEQRLKTWMGNTVILSVKEEVGRNIFEISNAGPDTQEVFFEGQKYQLEVGQKEAHVSYDPFKTVKLEVQTPYGISLLGSAAVYSETQIKLASDAHFIALENQLLGVNKSLETLLRASGFDHLAPPGGLDVAKTTRLLEANSLRPEVSESIKLSLKSRGLLESKIAEAKKMRASESKLSREFAREMFTRGGKLK
jgi:hypothetical protein